MIYKGFCDFEERISLQKLIELEFLNLFEI